MKSMALSLKQRQYVEAVIAVLPHLAEAVAAIPRDCQVKAFEAAERSYLRTFRQLGLSGPETWASSIMRRLRRRVRHEYELYLAVEDIDHSRTKTKSPQTNGICERFHKTG